MSRQFSPALHYLKAWNRPGERSSIGRPGYSFVDQINFCVKSGVEHINDDDVIFFCLYPMNKMRRNLIKIRSWAIFRSINRLDRFSNYFKDYEGVTFCFFDKN